MTQEKGSLSINSENIFPIIKKWLYSDQDIFIRELISNGVDAIAKLRKLASLGEATVEENPEYRVDVVLNPEDKLITITDNGIGMTDEEVKKYINQIAFSGAAEFMEKYKESSEDPIIGHFGLGFYSAFMVSTLVEIDTLSHQQGATPVHWSCDGGSEYSMEEGTRAELAQPSPSMSTRTAKSISTRGKCEPSLKSTAPSCLSQSI
ncbi:MAG: ATP-binding protein [Clostridia bacterium]